MREETGTLVEAIYLKLRQQLQLSEIAPPDRLVDTEIATRHGISRMPVREALLRLVAEGYLVGTTRGFAVRELSLEDISGLFEVRRQLEPRAAGNAARDMTPDVEAEITEAMNRVKSSFIAGDMPGLLTANIDFRNAWLKAVRNVHMAQTIVRFIDYFQSMRLGTFASPALAEQYIDGLSRIHCAFVARDPLAVQDRMTIFMFAAEEAFLVVRRQQLEEAAAPPATRLKKQKRGTTA